MICPHCKNDIEPDTELTPHLKHYGKAICPECSRTWWLPKPRSDERRRQTSRFKIEDLGIECCELCRRPKTMLGHNQTLEIHHKHLLTDGGEDARENIIVLCTACHKHVHWQKTYYNDHYLPFYQADCPEREALFAFGRSL